MPVRFGAPAVAEGRPPRRLEVATVPPPVGFCAVTAMLPKPAMRWTVGAKRPKRQDPYVTVTVAVSESTDPAKLLTRTQNAVVETSAEVS